MTTFIPRAAPLTGRKPAKRNSRKSSVTEFKPTGPPRRLREYQIEAADAIADAHARGVEGPAVVLPTGTGKAQPHDTIVPTPTGFRRFGDLIVGDEVFGADGRPTTVVAVHEQGLRPVLELGFSDGARTRVDPGHLFLARDAATKSSAVYRSADLAANLLMPDGSARWRIPVASPIEFRGTGRTLDDAFAAGAALRRGGEVGGEELNRYLTEAPRVRRAFLDGLLGEFVSVPSADSRLLETAAELIRSLGGLPMWVRYGGGDCLEPLWHDAGGLRRELISAVCVEDQLCRCITVSAEDGLYITGRDFVVTHNSTVIAELAKREVDAGGRVLLMAHRNELIEQMADAAVAVNPTGPRPSKIGGPHKEDPSAQIVSVTVQSLQSEASLARLGHRDLVIVDEAHHAVARTFRSVLDHFSELGARRAGFTATMIRAKSAKNEPALRTVWEEVVFERDIRWAIDNGFLIPPEGVTVTLPELDVDSLRTGGDGDITDDAAEEAMLRDTTLAATIESVVDHAQDLPTIVFGASLEHCRQLSESLGAYGVTSEVVIGEVTPRVRDGIYTRFRTGVTQVLVTVDVLTEGADFPCCEAVVLARPTRSQSRLVQCVGRALRPYTREDGSKKERALVIDLVGAGSLGLIVETTLDRREQREREAGLGCMCKQPCAGEDCDESCTGTGCQCGCKCGAPEELEPLPDLGLEDDGSAPCTCSCHLLPGMCRCGCVCDVHRVDPLVTFDPVSGVAVKSKPQRRGDAPWSQRTSTIRWTRHPRGLVRTIYRQTGSRGVLMLADMRGVPGTSRGKDWAFGFFDGSVKKMFWVGLDGQWVQPGPQAYLQGLSLDECDALAQRLFPDHMRDGARTSPSDQQVAFAKAIGIADAEELDRRDLADMIACAQADPWLPMFERPDGALG